jgi:hypothetical protein
VVAVMPENKGLKEKPGCYSRFSTFFNVSIITPFFSDSANNKQGYFSKKLAKKTKPVATKENH